MERLSWNALKNLDRVLRRCDEKDIVLNWENVILLYGKG
jgi:hypothetical protein